MGRHKKTDQEKNSKQQDTVDNFEIDKEAQLEKLKNQKIVQTLTQDVIDLFEVKPVPSTSQLSGSKIMPFSGKSYKDSIQMGYDWMESFNIKEKDKNKVILKNYYAQAFGGKNILLSYDLINLDGLVF